MKKSSEKHVYLVEDDLELSMALKMTLETEGFICHDCFTKKNFSKNSRKIILKNKNIVLHYIRYKIGKCIRVRYIRFNTY